MVLTKKWDVDLSFAYVQVLSFGPLQPSPMAWSRWIVDRVASAFLYGLA